MIEKITLDRLTEDSVSVKIQKVITEAGQQYEVAKPHRKAYMNSLLGRQQVVEELPETHQKAIFAVWGKKPTIE